MKPKLNIHFWDISGYINISFETKKLIFNLIKQKISLNKFSKKLKISGVSLNHFFKNKDSFIRISNLLEILKNINLSKSKIEKEIIGYKDTSSKDFFQIKFPYLLSPIHFRIGGVLIGDGNVHKTNKLLRWIQKDITPMKKLIEFVLNKKIYTDKKSFQIVIPSFFGKILCASLNLDFDSLANERFIDKILILPKNYRLALLISIIEDEGNIDVNNYGGINIRMSSKKIIFAIKQLCNSLDYKTSEIICYKNEGNFGNNIMYKVKINAEGIRKIGPDLLSLEKTFGNQISLWKKRKSFFDRWNKSIGEKAMKDLEGKKIHKQITELFKNNFQLCPLQISNELGIDYNRIYELIKNMLRRGELKRIGKGIYTQS
jgi:DNA-binding Xre family transcriptional regulator